MTTNLLETNPADGITSYRDLLVGEGKKFKDDEAVAKGKYESDNMIEILKRTNDEFRTDILKLNAELAAKANLEEQINQITAQQRNSNNQQTQVNEVKAPAIDTKQVSDLVSNQLKALKAAEQEQANTNLVVKTLKEQFGDNYQTPVKKQLETLGLTETTFNDLARNNPTFLLKALGADKPAQQEQFQSPPRNERRGDTFTPQGGAKRTWSFYQKMKQENPALYRSPKTNVDMHNDMMTLGDEFKDGDFNKY